MVATTPETIGVFSRRERAMLLVLCGALFLDALDVSMVGVSLASIQTDLHMGTSSLQWVVSAYTLGYAGFLLVGGRAADSFGRRRMFVLWLAVFTVASGLGGAAISGEVLIASRLITGISAAFTAPAALSLITTSFEGHARTRALTVFTATGASGFALGLVVGGALTDVHWRLVFLVPVVVSASVLAGALRFLPPSGDSEHRQPVDLVSAVLATGAMVMLVYAYVEAGGVGWLDPLTTIRIAAAATLAAGFVAVSGRSHHPLLRLGLLREPGVAVANLGGLILLGGWVSTLFLLTLYLQRVQGYSPLQTGLAVCPSGLVVALAAPRLAPPAVARYGPTSVAAGGLLAAAAAYALLLRLDAGSDYLTTILPSMLLVGLAFTFGFGPLSIAATAVADREQGVAAGVINTSFQLGPALMIAVVTAITEQRVTVADNADQLASAYARGVVAPLVVALLGVVALVGAVVVAARRRRTEHPQPSTSSPHHVVRR